MADISPPSLAQRLRWLAPLTGAPSRQPDASVGPIRGELFGPDRLADHARQLARGQQLALPDVLRGARRRHGRGPLLARLDETERVIMEVRETLAAASREGIGVSPAGAWLLDNFLIVLEQIREIRANLPGGYYHELPKLGGAGPFAGYPRVYEIAIELIAHTDGRLDAQNIQLMVWEYQRIVPLTMGELWAIPAMLRMGLVENIRRMALRTARDIADTREADRWATRFRDATDGTLSRALADFIEDSPEFTPAFLTRFLRQLRSRRVDFTPLLWLEQWIAEDAMSVEEAVQRSTQRLSLTQLVMANSITSLRTIANFDWRTFVESENVTEATLRRDPAGLYAGMTFATRDRYRHVVEAIAKRTRRAEPDVATAAIAMATAAASSNGHDRGADQRTAHVGYYLVDKGRVQLEHALGYRPTRAERVRRSVLRHPNRTYFSALALATVVALGLLLAPLPAGTGAAMLVLAICLALVPASDAAIAFVNQLVIYLVPPGRLPRLDYSEGVPTANRTVVVVPLLLTSVDGVRDALNHLEAQYLANRDPEIRFALLGDFTDADRETADGDAAIVAAATEGVRALNETYDASVPPFYIFHRPRLWNAREGMWMGWERKRGKLIELNEYLRGGARGAFSTVEGDAAWLAGVRYVITLDADTVLPRGAAAALIGTMAHPLNRGELDEARGRVVRGYGILQPRVGVTLESASRSRYAAIFAGHPGVDPYTTAVSDVYQDLYGEGTFTGKGIYDVDLFERATRGRFPENTLLSHDLIEGAFARAGLVTDVEVFDDYPSRYLTSSRREHRWIRGDWQLLPYLAPRIPGPGGPTRNPLSAISRWKLFDNMRRSLAPLALLAWLLAGWTVLPGSDAAWTLAALAALATPWLISVLFAATRPPRNQSWKPYYAALGHDATSALAQVALAIVFLPHQALVAADAILRTLGRVLITHRNLLEWQTASQIERLTVATRGAVWRRMVAGVVLALAAAVFATAAATSAGTPDAMATVWSLVLPLALLWTAAPEVAYQLSEPLVRRDLVLTPAERAAALRYALMHWRFFDRFVRAETQWLAPDNFQETPEPVIAPRASPTNIGLQLLSTVSAFDLGFLTRGEMLERLEQVFASLAKMRRVRGHFFNWYDLDDLRVLEPPYVSTVDSGNLAGHLTALGEACIAVADGPVDDGRVWTALDAAQAAGDVARVLPRTVADAMRAYHDARGAQRAAAAAAAVPRVARVTGEGDRFDVTAWSTECLTQSAAELERLALAAGTDPARTLREVAEFSAGAAEQVRRLEALARAARAMAAAMDFRLLYDERRRLFSIGYDERSGTLDASSYDLLASEARLASYVAVAKGDVPAEHWFRLGRTLTTAAGATALVSWSGSMFEYLMPLLVMPSRRFSLLDQTHHAAVQRQIAYGRARGVPWGISESAYNLRDRHDTYQYRAFGVPDLALKRGLANELVIAPYATALALQIDPHEALRNLAALEKLGALGAYGFREAIDYTRPDPDETRALVRAFMAHHVGMSLVALDNALHIELGEGVWQRRFMADPASRAAGLLLDERVPRRYVANPPQSDEPDELDERPAHAEPVSREIDTADTREPRVGLLGALPYSVLVTNAGSGYSRADGMAVTRWRADATRDDTGEWIYVKDVSTDRVWSAAYQPTCTPPDRYRATFSTDRIVFARRDGELNTRLEIVVLPRERSEIRRVTVTNRSRATREIELTSYAEVVLTDPEADRAHPAFQNLFVETEWAPSCSAVLASRRPHSSTERRPWCAHIVAAGPERVGDITCETDRARFIGRGRSARAPRALDRDVALSGTVGAVLDPIISLRVRVRLEPGRSATVAFTTVVADEREPLLTLADRYRDPRSTERARSLARTEAQVELRDLDVTPTEAALFQELAGALLYPHEELRAPSYERAENRRGQRTLWAHGISGDWPIVLATISDVVGLPSVRQLLVAHHYWRMKGVASDLVILNAKGPSYMQELQDQLVAMAISSTEGALVDKPGGVFIRRSDVIPVEDIAMLRATARIQIMCDGVGLGDITDPFGRDDENDARAAERPSSPALPAPWTDQAVTGPVTRVAAGGRAFGNGFGCLTGHGDYELRVAGDHVPPAPWANVVANPRAGFCITERGGGYAWGENSYFYRLTPWYNDPVSDPLGEVLYLQDADRQDASSGRCWTPTPGPAPARAGGGAYTVRHAAGFSSFTHERDGVATELTLAVPESDPVKISRLRITNGGARVRHLTLTSYVEWALGAQREHTRHQIYTRHDDATGAIFAQNFFADDFASRVAFSWVSEPVTAFTANREEFIGRNGDLVSPLALARDALAGTTGAGYDPCAAFRCSLTLAPGETRDVIVLLGAAANDDEARALIGRHGAPAAAAASIDDVAHAWDARLSTISVRTPAPEFDAMLNRWSFYQALSCRMWARSALYQSSGAYGFRDQLQDCMAFVYAEPAIARAHIIRSSGRQFKAGDVQHWWHEPSGRGVRTRFSDDLVWLPFVVDHYVRVTGDAGVWEERTPYLEQRPLEPHEQEAYEQPKISDETGTLYEHCARALDHAATAGVHGLPLMGCGDWNDGMNRVGVGGKGESVWLAWFLVATLRRFAEHADARSDAATAARCRQRADDYVAAVEREAWDGAWYRRAYFDDGTPLGSASNDECQIDAIAQSWSVISGAGDPERARQAMRSLGERLMREDARLIMLLTPPFDHTTHDPGYIKGYVPGVRENGAQYTHAALWSALAAARLGDGERAFHLLDMLNPLTHAVTRADAERYKVEPYAVCADVYTAAGHLGRGGWTWYTGSASWSYRVALEAVLGFTKRGDRLTIEPCVPGTWRDFAIEYRHGTSTYAIAVQNPDGMSTGVRSVEVDGSRVADNVIALVDDGARHAVVVTLGAREA